MKVEQAKKLVKFVNDPYGMEDLNIYLDLRIDYLRECLETAVEIKDVQHLQGAIKELRRFKHLREEVIQKANEG